MHTFANVPNAIFDVNVRRWRHGRNAADPVISEAVEVTCFSKDVQKNIVFGARDQLHKFRSPEIGSFLGENMGSFRNTFGMGEVSYFAMKPFISALRRVKPDIENVADVITFRNSLNRIATTPYNTLEEWEIDSVMVNGCVFLYLRPANGPEHEMHDTFVYYGLRFEQLCTGRQDEPVNTKAGFLSVIRTRIGHRRIFLCAEVDCENSSGSQGSSLEDYVELKTMKQPSSHEEELRMYRYRFVKFWVQTYLAGVQNVVLGYRDDQGILKRVEHMRTIDMPEIAKEFITGYEHNGFQPRPWEPRTCLNFLAFILDSVKKSCSENPGKTIRFRYDPEAGLVTGRVVPETQFRSKMTEFMNSEVCDTMNYFEYCKAGVIFNLSVPRWSYKTRKRAPVVSPPVEVTCFSKDVQENIVFGARDQLHTFRSPEIGSFLGENMGSFRDTFGVSEISYFAMKPFINALRRVEPDIENVADVITFRSNLNRIAATPYNTLEEWEIDSVMVNGCVFLYLRPANGPEHEMHDTFVYYGLRFEQLCTGRQDEHVNTEACFLSVIRTCVGNRRIFLCAEVDCEDGSGGGSSTLEDYVELKTMKQPSSHEEELRMYRYRFVKFWVQSYLAGVRNVVVGFRDNEGLLQKVEHFRTLEMPSTARRNLTAHQDARFSQRPWEPRKCLNFLDLILDFVKNACSENPGRTIRIRYDPTEKHVTGRLVPESEFGNLMTEYLSSEVCDKMNLSHTTSQAVFS